MVQADEVGFPRQVVTLVLETVLGHNKTNAVNAHDEKSVLYFFSLLSKARILSQTFTH